MEIEESRAASNQPGSPIPWSNLAMVLVAVIAVYAQCVGFGILDAWDDGFHVLDRPELHDWWGVSWRERLLTPAVGYPLPLPTLLYVLFRQLPAEAFVGALHGLNVALHLGSVAAAFLLARRWLESSRAALAAAALWGLHPLLAESVAWLTNLKMVLFGVCALSALLVWERQLDRPTLLGAVGAVGLFMLALGSRPEAASLIPVMLVRLWMHEPARLRDARLWAPIVACGLLIAAYIPVAMSGHQELVRSAEIAADPYQIDLLARIERMGAALWIQLSHVFVPIDLHPLYYPDDAVMTERAVFGGVAALFLMGATIWSWRRIPKAFIGLAVFWAFYMPASGIEVLPRFTADTYMYLPLFGLMIAVVAIVGQQGARTSAAASRWRFVVASVALLLGLLAFVQAARWQNAVTLFEPVIAEEPNAPEPYQIIGKAYLLRDNPQQAREYYKRGYSALYESGFISRGFIKTFEMTGSPERAAAIGLELYSPEYTGKPPDGLAQYLTWLVTEYDISPPSASDKRRLVSKLALEALPAVAQQWPDEMLREVSEHFRRHGEREVARRYAAAAQKTRSP